MNEGYSLLGWLPPPRSWLVFRMEPQVAFLELWWAFPSPLGSTVVSVALDFSTLVREGPRSCCVLGEGKILLVGASKTDLSLSVRSSQAAMTVLSQQQPVVSVRTRPCVPVYPARGLRCLLSQLVVGRLSRCPLFSYLGTRGNPNWFLPQTPFWTVFFSFFLLVGIETKILAP